MKTDNQHTIPILLVASSGTTMDFLKRCLQKKDWWLVECHSGHQAIAQMAQQEFALAIIESPLHDMSIGDLLATVNLNSHQKPPILRISSEPIAKSDRVEGHRLGVIDYLSKPVDLDIFLNKVQNHCQLYQYYQVIQETNSRLNQEIATRINLQHNLQQKYEELERRVNERNLELASTTQKLQESIAQHQDTEKGLQMAEAKYRDIFEHTIEGIFQTTADGKYIQVNRALANIYGYPSTDDMLDRLNDIENQLYVKPQRRHTFKAILERQDALQDFESQVYQQDGSIIWIKENARAVRNDHGELLYYEGTVTDITKNKLALETILNTNEAANRFVPHQLLKLLGKPSIIDLKLSDHVQKRITVLFADIRSFTTLSEQMTPIENFLFLNSYLSHMGPIIRKHDGFIDKYIGDSIMALFDKAQDAYKAAIGILEELEQYNAERENSGYVPIQIGMGINTGEAIVGAIGEQHRIQGTVIGNTVNTASRVEQLTKDYGVPLLVTESTFQELDPEVQALCRFTDTKQVKGKSHKVTIYEVFAHDPPDIQQLKMKTKSLFEEARLLSNLGKHQASDELLQMCIQEDDRDRLVQHFLQKRRESS